MPLLINNEVAKELLTMGACVEALEEAFGEKGGRFQAFVLGREQPAPHEASGTGPA